MATSVLKIGGVNKTAYLRQNTLDLSWNLKSQDTAGFELEGPVASLSSVSVGNQVTFTYNGTQIFLGNIDEIEYTRVGAGGSTHVSMRCRCTGPQKNLDKRAIGGDQTWGNAAMALRSLSSTVDTAGTAVTWVGGDQFTIDLAGQTITINLVAYTVSTVNSTTSLTLTTSAGTQTGVAASTTLYAGTAATYLVNNFASGEGVSTSKSRAGTVNTSVTAVTWASGDYFGSDMVGSIVTINGSTYTVSAVTDTEHLTLAATAGTQTGVAYSSTTVGVIAQGAEIPVVAFDYAHSVWDGVRQLARYSGYMARVDESGALFFGPKGYTTAAYAITDGSDNFRTITKRSTREDTANQVNARIAPSAVDPQIEAFAGDGSTVIFSVEKPIAAVEYIKVDGILRSYGRYNVDTNREFYFRVGFREIYQDTDFSPLTAANVIEIRYRDVGGDIITLSDSGSIASQASADGTTGKIERFVDRSHVRDTAVANTDAQAVLDRRKDIVDQVTWVTDTPGLMVGLSVSISTTAPPINGTYVIESLNAKDEDGKQLVFTATSGTGDGLDGPEDVLGDNPSDAGPGGFDGFGDGGGGGTDGNPGSEPDETQGADDHYPDKFTFGVGIGTVVLTADDVAFWYPVFAPGGTLEQLKITVKTAMDTDCILDIKRSADNGLTWDSIFVADAEIWIPSGFTGLIDKTDFGGNNLLNEDDMLRIDVLQGDGVTKAGIVVAGRFRVQADRSGNTDFSETTTQGDEFAAIF